MLSRVHSKEELLFLQLALSFIPTLWQDKDRKVRVAARWSIEMTNHRKLRVMFVEGMDVFLKAETQSVSELPNVEQSTL